MKKNIFPKIGIFLLLLFLVGSCQPNVDVSWRILGWRCKTGIGYRGLSFYCR